MDKVTAGGAKASKKKPYYRWSEEDAHIMLNEYAAGMTLQAIGNQYGITRQRVWEIIE